MAPKPLDILKKGLAKFKTVIKACKDELNAKLAQMETISAIDDHWLDNEAKWLMRNTFSKPLRQHLTMNELLGSWTKKIKHL